MAHRHVIGVSFTGMDIEDPDGGGHYHMVPGGERTSTDPEGPDHVHMVGDQKTSKPLPMLPDGPMDDDEAGWKKKKRKKPKWNY